MPYYTNVGPLTRPLLYSAGHLAIRVLRCREGRTPIGEALVEGRDRDGLALWRLTVDALKLPGVYVVIDREFRPAG
jgi:hypothetical protein